MTSADTRSKPNSKPWKLKLPLLEEEEIILEVKEVDKMILVDRLVITLVQIITVVVAEISMVEISQGTAVAMVSHLAIRVKTMFLYFLEFSFSICLSFSCLPTSSIIPLACLMCSHSSSTCNSFASTSSNNICLLFSSLHNFYSPTSCLLLNSSLILFSWVDIISSFLLASLRNCSSTLCLFCHLSSMRLLPVSVLFTSCAIVDLLLLASSCITTVLFCSLLLGF